MVGYISRKEFRQLKTQLDEKENPETEHALQELWETFRSDRTYGNTTQRVGQQLQERIRGRKNRFRTFRYAAILALPFIGAGLGIAITDILPDREQTFTVLTDAGEKSRIFLPDSSRVWINSSTRLSYDTDFGHRDRTVMLEGEAFFDVAEDKDRKFIVRTGDIDITVTGTSFNVSSYSNQDRIYVSLEEGAVSISRSGKEGEIARLSPGQKFIYSKHDGKYGQKTTDVRSDGIWRMNILKFEDEPASQVFRKLEAWYGLDIRTENMPENIRYGFTVKNESVREMLDLIDHITPIDYAVDGKNVIIRYE